MMKITKLKLSMCLLMLTPLVLNACNSNTKATTSSSDELYGTVTEVSMPNTLTASGVISPNQVSNARWEVSGTIGTVNVSIGDHVDRDEILMTLDESALTDAYKLTVLSFYQLTSEASIATAEKAVLDAQTTLNTAIYASKNLYQPDPDDLNTAYTNYYDALVAYTGKLDEYPRIAAETLPTDSLELTEYYQRRNDAISAMYAAYNTMDNLKSDLDSLVATATGTSFDEYNNQVNIAQADLQDSENYLSLLTSGEVPEDASSSQIMNYLQLKNQVNQINLRAPISGTVSDILDQSGKLVTQGQSSVTITDRSILFVTIQLTDSDIVHIKTGMLADISVTSLPDLELTGHVVSIASNGVVSNGTTTYDVLVQLDQAEDSVPLNAATDVTVILGDPTIAKVVPAAAVQSDTSGEYVTVIKNGVSQRVDVTSGKILSDNTVIVDSDALQVGDSVVLVTTYTSTSSNNGGAGPGLGGALIDDRPER